MDEELTLLEDENLEIYTEDLRQDVESEEIIEVVEVEAVEEVDIEVDESVGWVGGDSTRHYSLYGREEPDQHPITSITGLREELNDIEALGVVYSNERNQANYYLWEDENVLQEGRVGYFVSACSDINEIKICTSDNDIFGVTVDGAGFIGAQDDVARDIKYGLVVTTGVVHVRCELDVNVGDYVVSNDYGYAQKNDNGYKVVGRHLIDGVEYAEITLVTPINRMCELTDDINDLNDRMSDAETNIVAAINVANEAYNKASEVDEVSEEAIKNALEALDKANGSSNKVDEFESRLTNANEVAAHAKSISESAAVTAENIRKEAVATANSSLSEARQTQDNLDELIKEMTPLSQWEGVKGSGIAGFVARANADSATLASLAEWKEDESDSQSIAGTIAKVNEHEGILDHITNHQGINGSTIAQVEQKADDNNASITSLVASVDKYSVGEYSQAYGLTREQAANILKPGYVYIPTKHGDTSSHKEIFVGDDEENWFTSGDYYVWGINDQDNADWIEHSVGSVWISEAVPANSNNTYKYWYIDSNIPPQGYEAYALYIWEDSQWKKVNTLAGNASNRAVSMIRQTTNEIAAEITNARGDFAGLNARLEADREAQVAMVASVVGDDGKVTAASIINAVNESGSSTAITADHIVLNGYNITNGDGSFQIDNNGYMVAKGGTIGGWNITNQYLQGYIDENNYVNIWAPNSSNSHSFINLKHNGQYTFYVDAKGHLYASDVELKGKITAETGHIGGWYIGDGYMSSGRLYFIGNSGDGEGYIIKSQDENWNIKFGVKANGSMYAAGGTIGGWNITSHMLYYPSAYGDSGGLLNYGTGINSAGWSSGTVAFWAGFYGNGGNPFEHAANTHNPNESTDWAYYTNFYVTNGGRLRAKNAEIDGIINAQSGKIGNWTIDGVSLRGSWGNNFVKIKAPDGSDDWTFLDLYYNGKYTFVVSKSGHLTATDAEITGQLNAGSVLKDKVKVGSSANTEFLDYKANDSQKGAIWQITGGGSSYIALAKNYIDLYTYAGGTGITMGSSGMLSGTWYVDNPKGTWSDINKKKEIESMSETYDLFFDNLVPSTYKYIDGTSNRRHTGFIAQKVEEALSVASIDTQDFAGLMIVDRGTENEVWTLRYEEFISLNTWQIQKAKARITELENKVAELEKLIKEK